MAATPGIQPITAAVTAMRQAAMGFVAGRISSTDLDQLEQVFAIEMAKIEEVLTDQAETMGWNGTTTASPNIQAADSRQGFGYDYTWRDDMTRNEMQQLRQAEQDCRGILGDTVVAFDSGDRIYGAALRQLGVDTTKVPQSGLGVLYRQLKANGLLPGQGSRMAADSAPMKQAERDFYKEFPTATRLVVR